MVTKETFLKYLEIQKSGKYNMIMDSKKVMSEANISVEDYKDIITNYNIYYHKFC